MLLNYKKFVWLVAAGLFVPSLSLAAQLKDIAFSELPGEQVELRLEFDETPSEPSGYTIEQPARIVLDFAGVDNALDSKKFPVNIGGVKEAVVVSGGGRTRMILNLTSLTPYSTTLSGNSILVQVGESGSVAASNAEKVSAPAPSVTKSTNAFDKSKSTISGIDFRRGDLGEGKIIVNLSNPNIGIDIEEVASGVEVSFLQTALPSELNRKLDVSDFATPVKMISPSADSLRSTLRIDAKGEYDYLAYQADNEYVISIKPLTKAEIQEKKAKFAYTGEKLTLNFQDIEVRNVLQLIADVTGLNLVASDTVEGSITLRLDSVPWDQALDIVLKTKGLDKRQMGNVLMVAPAAEIADRERRELETKKQLEELAPLRTEYIRVRYANARELFELFIPQGGGEGGQGGGGSSGGASNRNSTTSILSERGSAIVDERTNSIILTDTEEKIVEFRRIIDQVDIPIRQVMIEARIVIANTDFRKELGASLGNGAIAASDGNRQVNILTGDRLDSETAEVGFANGKWTGGFEVETQPYYDLSVVGQNASKFAWNVIRDNLFLGLELSALEDSGYAEIVSQPKVITGDKQQASIESGTEIPYRDAGAGGGAGGGVAARVSFKKALLKLDVTPQITPDDKVIMDLVITQDSPGEETIAGPVIDVTKLETQVLVGDAQTVVLGGIFQNTTLTSQSKVPLLGDIPIIGRLFRKDTNAEEKRELLIFITPRIMSTGADS